MATMTIFRPHRIARWKYLLRHGSFPPAGFFRTYKGKFIDTAEFCDFWKERLVDKGKLLDLWLDSGGGLPKPALDVAGLPDDWPVGRHQRKQQGPSSPTVP
ncbi:MAG TPA: hypothetical protein VGV15_08310, partial [Terriglobales bacterium]|nr:hypothetical protein [Terriglobales bacterium]